MGRQLNCLALLEKELHMYRVLCMCAVGVTVVACALRAAPIVAGGATVAALSDEEKKNPVKALSSNDERVRRAAYEEIVAARSATIASLIEVLKATKKGEDWLGLDTPAKFAIKALGELRAEEAIPELLRWLLPPKGPYVARMAMTSPAGRALIKIGSPAVPEVLNVLAVEGGVIEQGLCVEVLVGIYGADLSLIVLDQTIKTRSNENEKQNLAKAKALISKRYPTTTAPKGS